MRQIVLVTAAAAALLVAPGARAEMFINGQPLRDAQRVQLERIACGPLADGAYWINRDGVWGYWGDPEPRGHIKDHCEAGSQPQASLSPVDMMKEPVTLLSSN